MSSTFKGNKAHRFKNKRELLLQAISDCACEDGLEFIEKQGTLDDVIFNCPLDYMVWALGKGYVQFGENFSWNLFDGDAWDRLLRKTDLYDEYCDWSKLAGMDWCWLLRYRPELHVHCAWIKLSVLDWRRLLVLQPELEVHMPDETRSAYKQYTDNSI